MHIHSDICTVPFKIFTGNSASKSIIKFKFKMSLELACVNAIYVNEDKL